MRSSPSHPALHARGPRVSLAVRRDELGFAVVRQKDLAVKKVKIRARLVVKGRARVIVLIRVIRGKSRLMV